jgi:hypothetical protein
MPKRGRGATVLILSGEAMGAALLGLLLERGPYEPAFAHPGETPEAAVKRVRPLFVILLDVAVDAARSDLFYLRAARRGVSVILYGNPADSTVVDELAARRGLRGFTLPITGPALTALLDEEQARERRDHKRPPRRASVDQAGDAILFTDRRGRRWFVYDRRVGERRADDRGPVYRAFVNEAGEEWRYGFAPDESADASVVMLERQLASAERYSAVE